MRSNDNHKCWIPVHTCKCTNLSKVNIVINWFWLHVINCIELEVLKIHEEAKCFPLLKLVDVRPQMPPFMSQMTLRSEKHYFTRSALFDHKPRKRILKSSSPKFNYVRLITLSHLPLVVAFGAWHKAKNPNKKIFCEEISVNLDVYFNSKNVFSEQALSQQVYFARIYIMFHRFFQISWPLQLLHGHIKAVYHKRIPLYKISWLL